MSGERHGFRVVLIAMAVLLCARGHTGAAVLFSTLSADPYDIHGGAPVGLMPGVGNFTQGNQFSFTGMTSRTLDSVELAAALFSGTNQLNVSLMSDAAGQPGSVIESFSFVGQMGGIDNNNPLLVGTSILHPLLLPDTNYWLVLSAGDDTLAAWNYASPSVTGMTARRLDAGPWNVFNSDLSAFRINGVPAPSALLLVGIGITLVGWSRRRTM
jgi:hypothetical protein